MKDYNDTVLLEVPYSNLQPWRTVQIKRSEAEAIQLCINPPALKKIDSQELSLEQEWEIDKFKGDWLIDSYWLIYLRSKRFNKDGNINIIDELPLTGDQRLNFQDRCSWAKVLDAQLNLCIGVYKAGKMPQAYITPDKWWANCMEERQYIQIEIILSNADSEVKVKTNSNKIVKKTLNKGLKFEIETKLLNSLKQNKKADENLLKGLLEKMPYLGELYRRSIQLASSSYNKDSGIFLKQFWKPYLSAYGHYIRNGIKNSDVKAIIRRKGKLSYQLNKALIAVKLKPKKS